MPKFKLTRSFIGKNLSLFLAIIFIITFIISYFILTLFNAFNANSENDEAVNPNVAESSSTTHIASSPTPSLTPTNTPTPTPIYMGLSTEKFYITYYGWPDNTPAGYEIAYPKSRYPLAKHNGAGGIGTYNDPITFATAENAIPIGTVYYVPYIKKYIIMEDLCATCYPDENHIDIWLESDNRYTDEVLECQRKFTRKEINVITKPTRSLPVDVKPLFDVNNGVCNN